MAAGGGGIRSDSDLVSRHVAHSQVPGRYRSLYRTGVPFEV